MIEENDDQGDCIDDMEADDLENHFGGPSDDVFEENETE